MIDTNPTTNSAKRWSALALTTSELNPHSGKIERYFDQAALAWPVALIWQIIAAGTVVLSAILSTQPGMWPLTATIGAGVMALGALGTVALIRPPIRAWPAHRRMRLAMGYGAGLGAGLMALLWQASGLEQGGMQLASLVGIFGAMVATSMALHPMRAALFAYVAAIAVTMSCLSGLGLGMLFALGCVACVAAVTWRLALYDADEEGQSTGALGPDQLATRLVGEFEAQGTGWFWQTDREGCLTYLSPKVANAVTDLSGPPIGRLLTAVFQMDSVSPGTERTLGFHLSSRTGFADYPVRPASLGTISSWWSISGRPVIDRSGKFQGFIGSGSDLTEKRRSEAEITRLALFDGLTGLANRQRMAASLNQALKRPGGAARPTTLFLLDLDRFKAVNDTLGHQTGDALLVQVGQRLVRSIGDAGLVGRVGGDEFQVVLPDEDDIDVLSELARSVIASLSQPYSIDGTSITIGCSIGIAIAAHDGSDSETLIRNADLALYAAKADGRGVHRFYREELLHGAQNRKQLEDDLRQALVNDQFHLVYQPVVCTESARIVGYEALLRWEHPSRGNISPTEFIPIAEDCGLIESIGEWVLRTACLDAAHWPNHVRIGVNVSPIQFANPALPSLVTNALAKSGIAPGRLELEITEGVFLNESASSDAMFKALKGLGVRLALDDFGTGYSSLGYLRSAPFDKIKIDQSFVRGAAMPGNRNAAIIKAIVTLAKTLNMETTAEGVEAQDEIELIRELGCSHIQGFVYGRPARTDEVYRVLTEGGGMATAIGYKVSRSHRTAMMRTVMLHVGDAQGEVRLRNISPNGALIDGIDFGRNAQNLELLIELIEGQLFAARVRWNDGGRAGVEFAENFNLERLTADSSTRSLRKTG